MAFYRALSQRHEEITQHPLCLFTRFRGRRAGYFDRYPGDKYVDILGLDFYRRDSEAKREYIANVQRILEMLQNSPMRNGKPYVFSETGSEDTDRWFRRCCHRAKEV